MMDEETCNILDGKCSEPACEGSLIYTETTDKWNSLSDYGTVYHWVDNFKCDECGTKYSLVQST